MSYENLLIEKVDIYRKTVSKNNDAGYTTKPVWTEIATDVPCRINHLFESSSGIRILTGGATLENDYIGFFKKNVDIVAGDKVTYNGMDLFVKPIFNAYNSTTIHHKEVYLGMAET
jgi:hypothetical protein